MAIVGEFNKNLIQIEKLTKTKLYFRGNSITIKGKAIQFQMSQIL